MAHANDAIIDILKRYVKELALNGISVQDTILFGSYAKGTASKESDIDVAIISESFTGDRFEDRRKIVPLRRFIDSRIEPIPILPTALAEGGVLIDEIKQTGLHIV